MGAIAGRSPLARDLQTGLPSTSLLLQGCRRIWGNIGYIGIMETKMETTIKGLGFSRDPEGFGLYVRAQAITKIVFIDPLYQNVTGNLGQH